MRPLPPGHAYFVAPERPGALEVRPYEPGGLRQRLLQSAAGLSARLRAWAEHEGHLPVSDPRRLLDGLRSELGEAACRTATFRRLVEIPVARPGADLLDRLRSAQSAYLDAVGRGQDLEDLLLDAEAAYGDAGFPFPGADANDRRAVRREAAEALGLPAAAGQAPRRACDLSRPQAWEALLASAQAHCRRANVQALDRAIATLPGASVATAAGLRDRARAAVLAQSPDFAACRLDEATLRQRFVWQVATEAAPRVAAALGTDLAYARSLAASAVDSAGLQPCADGPLAPGELAAWRTDLEAQGIRGFHDTVTHRALQELQQRLPGLAAEAAQAARLLQADLADRELLLADDLLHRQPRQSDPDLLAQVLAFRRGAVAEALERVARCLALVNASRLLDAAQREHLVQWLVRRETPPAAVPACIDLAEHLFLAVMLWEQAGPDSDEAAASLFKELTLAFDTLWRLPTTPPPAGSPPGRWPDEMTQRSQWLDDLLSVALRGERGRAAPLAQREPVADRLWQALQLPPLAALPEVQLLRHALRVLTIAAARTDPAGSAEAVDAAAFASARVRPLPSVDALEPRLRQALRAHFGPSLQATSSPAHR